MKIIQIIKNGLCLIILTCLISFGRCTIEIPESRKENEKETEKEPEKQTQQKLLVQLVNSYRTAGCDCGSAGYFAATTPVAWNEKLEQAALDHSEDMFANNSLNHTGSDGSDPGTRMTRRGYDWKTYGENIAWGYQTDKSVMEGWIKSPGHCRNIMNPDFKEMGAAQKGSYWTLVLGKR